MEYDFGAQGGALMGGLDTWVPALNRAKSSLTAKVEASARWANVAEGRAFGWEGAMAEHFGKIGKGLENAIAAYNSAVGSMEARVLPAARRFKDLGASTGDEIPPLTPVETTPRTLTAAEAKERNKE